MTNFEKITAEMDMNDLVGFLNSLDSIENAPWSKWFNAKYCNLEKCPTITCKYVDNKTCECAYCELNKKKNGESECCFFPEKNILGSGRDVIKLWLESDIDDSSIEM